MVGVVDVASHEVEQPADVATIIRQAMRHADAERTIPCTNYGLAPLPRQIALKKLDALAAGTAMVWKNIATF